MSIWCYKFKEKLAEIEVQIKQLNWAHSQIIQAMNNTKLCFHGERWILFKISIKMMYFSSKISIFIDFFSRFQKQISEFAIYNRRLLQIWDHPVSSLLRLSLKMLLLIKQWRFFLKTHWVRVIDILITYYSIRDKKNFFLILFKISKIKMDLIIFNIEFFFHNFFNNI